MSPSGLAVFSLGRVSSREEEYDRYLSAARSQSCSWDVPAAATPPKGRLIQKHHLQLTLSVNTPPSNGPITEEMTNTILVFSADLKYCRYDLPERRHESSTLVDSGDDSDDSEDGHEHPGST